MKNIFINGFGRIGRLIFRQINCNTNINIVGINDLTSTESLAYLLKYDSAQGTYNHCISFTDTHLIVGDRKIPVFSYRNPADIPHKDLKTEIVVESTGLFVEYDLAKKHIDAGAKKVLLSAPGKGLKPIKTIVYNVNHKDLTCDDLIVSGASCTTNALAPVVHALDNKFKIQSGLMTTVHAATNDQRVLDLPHKDFRRGRSALNNIIPTNTGAAASVGKVLPHLKGLLNGIALRVPLVTGSVVDFVCKVENNKITVEDVNNCLKEYCNDNESIKYNCEPIVSVDIIGSSYGSIFDATLTDVIKDHNGQGLIKAVAFYDNENSYVSQYVRTLKFMLCDN